MYIVYCMYIYYIFALYITEHPPLLTKNSKSEGQRCSKCDNKLREIDDRGDLGAGLLRTRPNSPRNQS